MRRIARSRAAAGVDSLDSEFVPSLEDAGAARYHALPELLSDGDVGTLDGDQLRSALYVPQR